MRTVYVAALTLAMVPALALAQPLTGAFTYQGELLQGSPAAPANGVFDLTFRLVDGAGVLVPGTVDDCKDNVTVVNGRFTVSLNFGAVFFNGDQRALRISVRPDPTSSLGCANLTGFTTLSPAQPLNPSPYSLYAVRSGTATSATTAATAGNATNLSGQPPDFYLNANNLGSGTLPGPRLGGTYSSSLTLNNNANVYFGSGANLMNLNANNITSGVLLDTILSTNVALRNAANNFTAPTNSFVNVRSSGWIGSDTGPVELRTTNAIALRLIASANVPNVLAGDGANVLTAGVRGGTIAGGGPFNPADPANTNHRVRDDYGTIGGGASNRVGDGLGATSDRPFATVGGGVGNTASGSSSTVAGGGGNTASNTDAVVVGGGGNSASGPRAFVGGGHSNQASALQAIVVGGFSNTASGESSFVGGGGGNQAGGLDSTIAGGGGNQTLGERNTIGGGRNNLVRGDYGTIAGGGPAEPLDPTNTNNRVHDDYGTIGGGGWNRAGSDDGNTLNDQFVTIAGGSRNTASAGFATIGGGASNIASGVLSTVAGGGGNQAEGPESAIGGGSDNRAPGFRSTVPGGAGNVAGGFHSFAAGLGAGVRDSFASGDIDGDEGTFVWADTSGFFQSTGPNQFLIQATGGVGINTNAPVATFDVNGSVSAAVKFFRIDHPIDPTNTELWHASIESDQMKNLYDGVVTTNADGYAIIALPGWFQALNKDFRYQLTVIDEADSAEVFLWAKVVRKIGSDAPNQFTIRTARGNVEVSWLVTGVRQDTYATTHPMQVERAKTATARGRRLYAEPASAATPK